MINIEPNWASAIGAFVNSAAAIAMVAIAFIVAMQTYRQTEFQRGQLRLALFTRRARSYTSAQRLIADVTTEGKAAIEKIIDFYWRVGEATFLLSDDVAVYLSDFLDRVDKITLLDQQAEKTRPGPDRDKWVREQHELREWVMSQREPLVAKFKPYLSDWPT